MIDQARATEFTELEEFNSEILVNNSSPNPPNPTESNLHMFAHTFPGTLGAMLVTMGSGVINAIMASHVSTTAMAALALSGSVIWPLNAFGSGMLGVILSRMGYVYGQGHPEQVGEVQRQSYYIIAITCVVIMLFLWLFAVNLDVFGINQEIIDIAKPYLLLNILNVPLVQFIYHFRNLNNCIAYTLPNLWLSIVQLILLVPLNYLFMYDRITFLGNNPAMSAFTFMIIYFISIVFQIFLIKYRKDKYGKLKLFTPIFSKPNHDQIKDIMHVGIPLALQYWMENSFYGIVTIFIGHLGTAVIAAHEAAMIMYGVCYSISIAANSTLTSMVSRRLGEHDRPRAHSALRGMLIFVFGCNLVVAALLIIFRYDIISMLIRDNPVALALAMNIFIFLAISNIFDGLYSALMGYLIPYRDSKFCIIVSSIFAWVIFMPIACVLGFTTWFFGYGNYGLYSFWTSFICIAIVCFVLYFLRAVYHWNRMPDAKLYSILAKQELETNH